MPLNEVETRLAEGRRALGLARQNPGSDHPLTLSLQPKLGRIPAWH